MNHISGKSAKASETLLGLNNEIKICYTAGTALHHVAGSLAF